MKSGAPGRVETWPASEGRYLMKRAPSTSPGSDPSPPTTAPTTIRIESRTVKLSGLTISDWIAKSDPATRIDAAEREGEGLVEREVDACRGSGGLAVADRAEGAPEPSAHDQPRDRQADQADPPRQVVEEVVRGRRVAEDGDRPLQPGHLERRRLEEAQALAAARQARELLQQRGHRHREREGGEREIEPREPQCGDPDQEADDSGCDPGERNRPDVAPVLVHDERGGRVAADRHQRAVAERDLAGIAGQEVEPDDRDEEHACLRQVPRVEVADQVGHQQEDADGGCGREERDRDPEHAPHQTLLTAVRPNRPAGLIRRTPRITASATGRRRSLPTQST